MHDELPTNGTNQLFRADVTNREAVQILQTDAMLNHIQEGQIAISLH